MVGAEEGGWTYRSLGGVTREEGGGAVGMGDSKGVLPVGSLQMEESDV